MPPDRQIQDGYLIVSNLHLAYFIAHSILLSVECRLYSTLTL